MSVIKDVFTIAVYIAIIIAGIALLAWLVHFQYDHALPVVGCVAEKVEASSGYDRSLHVLRLDVGAEKYMYITTSARVYNAVVEGACYRFTGPRSGMSYNGVKVQP